MPKIVGRPLKLHSLASRWYIALIAGISAALLLALPVSIAVGDRIEEHQAQKQGAEFLSLFSTQNNSAIAETDRYILVLKLHEMVGATPLVYLGLWSGQHELVSAWQGNAPSNELRDIFASGSGGSPDVPGIVRVSHRVRGPNGTLLELRGLYDYRSAGAEVFGFPFALFATLAFVLLLFGSVLHVAARYFAAESKSLLSRCLRFAFQREGDATQMPRWREEEAMLRYVSAKKIHVHRHHEHQVQAAATRSAFVTAKHFFADWRAMYASAQALLKTIPERNTAMPLSEKLETRLNALDTKWKRIDRAIARQTPEIEIVCRAIDPSELLLNALERFTAANPHVDAEFSYARAYTHAVEGDQAKLLLMLGQFLGALREKTSPRLALSFLLTDCASPKEDDFLLGIRCAHTNQAGAQVGDLWDLYIAENGNGPASQSEQHSHLSRIAEEHGATLSRIAVADASTTLFISLRKGDSIDDPVPLIMPASTTELRITAEKQAQAERDIARAELYHLADDLSRPVSVVLLCGEAEQVIFPGEMQAWDDVLTVSIQHDELGAREFLNICAVDLVLLSARSPDMQDVACRIAKTIVQNHVQTKFAVLSDVVSEARELFQGMPVSVYVQRPLTFNCLLATTVDVLAKTAPQRSENEQRGDDLNGIVTVAPALH